MGAPRYVFHSRWLTRNATAVDVADVLVEPARLPEWWPDVYLATRVIEPGGEHGLGSVIDLHTKGRLPYTLRWQLRIESVDYPNGSTVSARGDLTGRGVWTHRNVAGGVESTYDWEVEADKPLLRYLSFVLRPLFTYNHRWAMANGEAALQREVDRRRRSSAGDGRITSP